MKKVVIAFAIATFAVVTQAASLNWSMAAKVATESPTGSSSAGRAAFYTAMVFLSSDLDAVTAALKGGELEKVSGLAKSTSQAARTGQFSGEIANLDGKSASIFAVVFDTQEAGKSINDAVYYQITDAVTQNTYSGAEPATTAAFTSAQVHNSYAKIGAGGDTPGGVPEPTSGLLLLLGAAGLALRRKQK